MDRNVSQNYPKSIAMCRLIARARPLRCARATVDRSATAEPPSQPAERRWCENIVDRNVSKNYPKSIAMCRLIARARPLGARVHQLIDRRPAAASTAGRAAFAVWPPRPHSTLASSARGWSSSQRRRFRLASLVHTRCGRLHAWRPRCAYPYTLAIVLTVLQSHAIGQNMAT